MTEAEIVQQSKEIQDTLAVLHAGLSEAMGIIRTEPLEVDVQIRHANRVVTARRPNPALKKVREISAAIYTLEKHLKRLHVEEKDIAAKKALEESPWNNFKPKGDTNGNS
jgi:hypothetical protein